LEKLVHKCNKRGVEGEKNPRNQEMRRMEFFLWRVEFFKIGKRDLTLIREMRVTLQQLQISGLRNGYVVRRKITILSLF
jgi:hypothetical protein